MNNRDQFTTDKLSQLDAVMKEVAACQLCCGESSAITEKKRLRNIISEKPYAPRYGEIPSHYTDWANRLNAKIVIVMKDWGRASDALKLRAYYEGLITNGSFSRDQAWRETVENRPNPSPTHKKINKYLKSSAEAESVFLPPDFLNHILFTNAVLCFRRDGGPSDKDNIDLPRSLENCCGRRKYLRRQLQIVSPTVVVALGQEAWQGLCRGGAINNSSQEFVELAYPNDGLSINVVRTPHPVAWGPDESKINAYRLIWKALSHILGLQGEELVKKCFGQDN
jgi:hypothetical protein